MGGLLDMHAEQDCVVTTPIPTPPTPESELVARLRDRVDLFCEYLSEVGTPSELPYTAEDAERDAQAATTIERLHSELRLCRAALLAERMCADILEDGGEERLASAHEQGRREAALALRAGYHLSSCALHASANASCNCGLLAIIRALSSAP